MLRAVTFDLWETLIKDVPEHEPLLRQRRITAIEQVLRRHGLDPDPAALETAHREVWLRMDALWKARRDLSTLEQTRLYLEIALGAGQRIPGPALDEAALRYGDSLLHYPPRPVPGAAEALAHAKSRGLRIALICNTGRTPGRVLRVILHQLGIAGHIESYCFSDELGICKPDPEMFFKALAPLGVRPDEAIHVGDRPDLDLAGARAAGLRSVHLRIPNAPEGEADHVIPTMRDLPAIIDAHLTDDR
ncbi:MAG TPA: HAD family hydrolase [Planctomycetota bacterium]|nr:HAD family hydrolase [Planctomycetota bacterium]